MRKRIRLVLKHKDNNKPADKQKGKKATPGIQTRSGHVLSVKGQMVISGLVACWILVATTELSPYCTNADLDPGDKHVKLGACRAPADVACSPILQTQ